MEIPPILRDGREIQSIFTPDVPGSLEWDIGFKYVDEIRAYPETGPASYVPYFAVIRDGQVITRIPGHMVIVTYVDEE